MHTLGETDLGVNKGVRNRPMQGLEVTLAAHGASLRLAERGRGGRPIIPFLLCRHPASRLMSLSLSLPVIGIVVVVAATATIDGGILVIVTIIATAAAAACQSLNGLNGVRL